MINRILKTGAILLIMTFILLWSNRLEGVDEVGLNFEVPPPENSELLDTPSLKLFNTDLKGATYKSQENLYRITAFYGNFFNQQGFKKTLDTTMPGGKISRIQFRKQNLVVDIVLTPKQGGTDVGIAKYILPEKVSKLEDMALSMNDSVFILPKADMPGEDLDSIPRPPSSVRIADMRGAGTEYLTYTTRLPMPELREFYKGAMKHGEWQPKSEIDMAELTANYKRLSGNTDLGLGKSRFPFQGSRDLEEIVSQGYVLEFTSGVNESVRITIMPGFFGRDPDNIVQIAYSEESDEGK